jgi:hypothetical protein
MKRLALIAVVAALAPASAQAAKVEVMVVGKQRVLRAPSEVRLKVRTVKVAGRRCRVGAATPLSVLVATKLRLGLRDYGRCGRRPRDAAGLYVTKVRNEREKGRGGWVYKVGRRTPSTGAADPSGSRLRDGQHVTWFWCEQDSSGGCQRTLEARPERTTAAPGETLRVTVRGYDDYGRGIAVEGATVRLGSASAVSGTDGVAVLTVVDPGEHELHATRDGMVRAFPVEVSVG